MRTIVLLVLTTLVMHAFADLNVRRFGAKGDGVADETRAFQSALDAAAKQPAQVVLVPNGRYRFLGSLNVPSGITLKGTWESVPSHNGLRDKGLPKPTDDGSTLLIEAGEGTETTPFLTLNTNSTAKGLVFFYPKQPRNSIPTPYPFAIAMRGKNPAVLDCELLNPYNGIDACSNERHLIRNVSGQPLRRGIVVEHVYDIGRIENVHFNPWWSWEPVLQKWQQENGEAFIFGRTDWQYVTNTFCFGYNTGYHFIESKDGVCNGNFLGIGADDCFTAVSVDNSAVYGLLITNGEFVSFHGPDPVMVRVGSKNVGAIRFTNCAFWGPCHQIASVDGGGVVGFTDCNFVEWDRDNAGLSAISATGGNLLVRGCWFRLDKPGIKLGPGVTKAIVSANLSPGDLKVDAPAGKVSKD